MALYSVRLSPSPAACEPACGVAVLLGRFLQEHGRRHAVDAVHVGLRLFPGGPDQGLQHPELPVVEGQLAGRFPQGGVVLRGRRLV